MRIGYEISIKSIQPWMKMRLYYSTEGIERKMAENEDKVFLKSDLFFEFYVFGFVSIVLSAFTERFQGLT